jgi:hypothetical protein
LLDELGDLAHQYECETFTHCLMLAIRNPHRGQKPKSNRTGLRRPFGPAPPSHLGAMNWWFHSGRRSQTPAPL